MKRLNLFFLTFLFLTMNCHYKKDKLKIKNNSAKYIYYHVLVKYRNENVYYGPSIGGKVDPGNFDSPGIRGSILHEMNTNSYDKTLYIVYFNEKDREYVFKNENIILFDKRFKNDKYSIKELDSMNWVVNYPRP
ncbi:hypothetical protein [Flavobacterium sp. 2755]|uniref:hypothetical protein n=1 Tax=Flavobacterium sp. 2755 TaxID=2817765 RepID=UPI00286BE90C|nr:hypothetical protein [Flavobacterium sp. 2755]